MAARAAIFGCEGRTLSPRERAFFRDADPWGFILFARNIDDPAQVSALTSDLRASVGRDAPVLIDQEGGRVARMRAPHWRDWSDVRAMVAAAGPRAEEALRLRYRLIAGELRAVGIDVNCAPVLDLPMDGGHPFLRDRALSSDAAEAARLGRAVRDGLEGGGVAAVVKHMPGHGRADADSHQRLPRVTADAATLRATDFAAFRPHADAAMGMTAHVLYEALDPEACGTFSPVVVRAIRDEIGFDGLLMTDDLSMGALDGDMASRVSRALRAGVDVALHCCGRFDEMEAVAGAAGLLEGAALRRARAAEARPAPQPFDVAEADAALRRMTATLAHA
jgi:beta-N-acetylhexosaminidase